MYSPTISNQFIRRASRFGTSQFSTSSMSPHGNLRSSKFIPASGFPNPSLKVDSIDISSTKLKFESAEDSSNSLSDTSNKDETGLKDMPMPMPTTSIEEIGEAIDNQVMNRINGIQAKRNQKRVTYKGEEDDRASDPNLSAAMQKNKSLVKKIDRFRTFKGMMLNSKEHKFEQRLKQFSNVKTFIKISQVIKNISDSVQNSQPKRPSKNRPSNLKLTRSPSNESLKRSVSKLQTPHNGLNSDEANPSTKKDLNGKALEMEEIELDEVYQQLKENIIRQIGIEAFETIEADLLDPTKQKEVKTRTKAQIKKLREMRDQMKNSNIFHSLIDHLATSSKVQAKNEYEEEVEARNTPFYQKLDEQIKQQNIEILTMLNTISTDENPEKEVGPPKLQLRTLLLKHELERNEELTKGYIPPSFDKSFDQRKEEADGQLIAAGLLGKYKERSQKVIEILKKKTMRIKSENTSAKVKATIEADRNHQNKIFNRLGTIDSASVSASTTSNKRAKVVIKKQEKNAQDEVKGTTNLPYLGKASIFRSQTKIDLQVSSPMNKKEEPSLTPKNKNYGSQSARFQSNVLENKQKYYKNTQKQNSLKLGFGSSPKYSDRSGSDFNSYALYQSYYGKQSDHFIQMNRSGSHSVKNSYGVSFDNSMEGIKGMLSELSLTNRQFESELSESQRRMEEYYNTQMDSMQAAEVPDSLRIQIKQEDAKSRAALIMKLTKRVLRDAYD